MSTPPSFSLNCNCEMACYLNLLKNQNILSGNIPFDTVSFPKETEGGPKLEQNSFCKWRV